MWTYLFIVLFLNSILADEDDFRIVELDSGPVKGDKYWNGDYYEFYGIPYATVPTGRNRFKGPEPVKPWETLLSANNKNILCYQCYYTEESEDSVILAGEEQCLIVNVLVPKSVNEEKLVPVVVYIHSGAFSGGSANMAKFGYLARHDIIVVSFNYRVGAFGFACLGNKEIPGNAGLKDQVEALRWIKRNIKKFGGDPDQITLAGFSVGATMAELLALSKSTEGLFNQLILESGSALSPFAINRDPVATAWNIALAMGYNGTANLEELTEFYLNVDTKDLALKSLNYFLPNSTFGYVPCIERVQEGEETIITESPLDIMKRGDYPKVPVVTGFSNMEGLSRTIKFGTWRDEMNENFANFLPADLKFPNEKEKEEVIKTIKQRYFDNKSVTAESLARYVDYFSDAMFKYGIMRSAKLHSSLSKKPVYLYEFSYVGNLNIQHNYMDRIRGASHRDQTAYILDFFGFTNNYRDLDTRERMTTMWTDYVQYGNPTEYESSLLTIKWPTYTKESQQYLEINKKLQIKQGLFNEEYDFWDKIYEKYYWNPTTVKPELNVVYQKETETTPKTQNIERKADEKLDISKHTAKVGEKIINNDQRDKINKIENQNEINKDHISKESRPTEQVENKINDNNKKSNLKRKTTIKSLNKDGKLETKVIERDHKQEASNSDTLSQKDKYNNID